MLRLTASQAAKFGIGGKRRQKYHAKPVTIDGVRFASKAEGARYGFLKHRLADGLIAELELQPSFALLVQGGKKVGVYKADFAYIDCATGERVIEDVKGMKTPVYRLKKKIVEAVHGITIREIS